MFYCICTDQNVLIMCIFCAFVLFVHIVALYKNTTRISISIVAIFVCQLHACDFLNFPASYYRRTDSSVGWRS